MWELEMTVKDMATVLLMLRTMTTASHYVSFKIFDASKHKGARACVYRACVYRACVCQGRVPISCSNLEMATAVQRPSSGLASSASVAGLVARFGVGGFKDCHVSSCILKMPTDVFRHLRAEDKSTAAKGARLPEDWQRHEGVDETFALSFLFAHDHHLFAVSADSEKQGL